MSVTSKITVALTAFEEEGLIAGFVFDSFGRRITWTVTTLDGEMWTWTSSEALAFIEGVELLRRHVSG